MAAKMKPEQEIQFEWIATEDLVPNARNPRKHDTAQVQQIVASFREFGVLAPIVIDEQNSIVAGHGRLLAALKLKLKRLPCVRASHLTETQKKAYMITDNKLTENSIWDQEQLGLHFVDLSDAKFDLGLTGFTQEEISEMNLENVVDTSDREEIEDAVPEVDEKLPPTCKRGEIWLLGEHRLMCGDSTSEADVARLMAGEKALLLVTDPPYGVSYADKNAFLNAIAPANRIQERIENDHMTADEMNEMWNVVLANAHKACAENASYYIFSPQGGDLMMMMMSIKHAKWQLKHMLVWVKNNHVLGRCDYNYKHEPVFFGWKENGTHKFYGDASCVSVLSFDKPLKNDLHPTMKPVELCSYLIGNSSQENEAVLDIFCGSGSTLIACEKTGRRCYGMEISPHYCDVIIKRWQEYVGKKAVREDGTEWSENANKLA